MRAVSITRVVLAALSVGACGSPPVCTSATCAPGVCQANGQCAPLVDETGFGASRALAPVDWAETSDRIPHRRLRSSDAVRVGGNYRTHLRFDRVPERAVHRAMLTLYPDRRFAGFARATDVVIHRTTGFDSEVLTARSRPDRAAEVEVLRATPGQRRLEIDVTLLLEGAQAAGDSDLSLEISSPRARRVFRFASPWVRDRQKRPTLFLMMRPSLQSLAETQ
ncbi:MAG: hypothetical protein AAGF12_35530 [Myxococcota bacterium]